MCKALKPLFTEFSIGIKSREALNPYLADIDRPF